MPVCDLRSNRRLDSHAAFRCHSNWDYVLTPTGDIATICGKALLFQHILNWVSTPLGEDIDPKVGCILHRYTFAKGTRNNYSKLELELKANMKYNFPDYEISNVTVISAFDETTNTHGIAVSALFNSEEIAFFTDSEGLAEMWRDMRKALGSLAYITDAGG